MLSITASKYTLYTDFILSLSDIDPQTLTH